MGRLHDMWQAFSTRCTSLTGLSMKQLGVITAALLFVLMVCMVVILPILLRSNGRWVGGAMKDRWVQRWFRGGPSAACMCSSWGGVCMAVLIPLLINVALKRQGWLRRITQE